MRILIIENHPDYVDFAIEQLNQDNEVTILVGYREFVEEQSRDKNFLRSFNAVLLAETFLLEQGEFIQLNGLEIALRAMQAAVPYVGFFAHTNWVVASMAERKKSPVYGVGPFTVTKVGGTNFGMMVTEPEYKDWFGLLLGLKEIEFCAN